MSISKEMTPTSTPNTKKSRGRPKTAFVSQKPKIKQDGPGRPKKHIEIETKLETPIVDEKPIIIEENKRKDTFILATFLFSLCVFSASLYFSGKKQSMEEYEQPVQQLQEATVNENAIIENTTPTQQTGIQENNTGDITDKTPDTANNIVSSFYDALNRNALSEIYPNIDSRLRNTKLFKVYFSKPRLQRFLNNLSEEGVQMTQIDETESAITYKLNYALKDGELFEEIREIGLITKDNIPLIGKMKCINTGCSTLPFFNPGKYKLQ